MYSAARRVAGYAIQRRLFNGPNVRSSGFSLFNIAAQWSDNGINVWDRVRVFLIGGLLAGVALASQPGHGQAQTRAATTPARAAQQAVTATPTATLPPTLTPTATQTPIPTATPAPSITPTATITPIPTSTVVPTVSPSGGIAMTLSPASVVIRPGQTIVVQVSITWNPTNAQVTLSQAPVDPLSAALTTNSTWSPAAAITGVGTTQLVLGTTAGLSPGVYGVQVTANGPSGLNFQRVAIQVNASATQFDNEVLRRGEQNALGPEILAPYRGGDSFFYQPRVGALLQWRPERNTYFNANTSELLDLSVVGPGQYRLPGVGRDEVNPGGWDQTVDARFAWLTDPVIKQRYFAPPAGVTGPWNVNGSIVMYGLPVSKPTQIGPYVVQRFQRAVIRHWVASTPAHPEWKDSVAVVPLQQAVLNFMPEIDPIAAGQIARVGRGGPPSPGWWEIDGVGANGFASAALEGDDPSTARLGIANPTGMWLEATLIGTVGTQAELIPGQTVVSDWPGLLPLSWILEPGQNISIAAHPNLVHPDPIVRNSTVMHVWMRPTARSQMAQIAQAIAGVGVPELGELHGTRLTTYYRSLLGAAAQKGAGNVGCLTALDGDVNAGDDAQFVRDLACAVRTPMVGYVIAEAAAAIGVGVDPTVVSGRLTLDALANRLGGAPATDWFWWNLQLAGREPGGRIRISRTGAAAGG